MIQGAERAGKIKPGDTLVEGTAGNTGIGLALVAQQKGYRLILVVPDKMSREKIFNLKAMGAEVVLTRSDVAKGHPQYYQDWPKKIARDTPGAYFINQFGNPDNPLAHETGTGPEILRQMDGQLDAIVFGCGSSGTMTGLSRYFAMAAPNVELVLADPVGSILAQYINEGTLSTKSASWMVEASARISSQHFRFFTGKEGLRDQRQGKLPRRPRATGKRRHPRRFIDRNLARRGAEILP